jgi:hypothetical protein
MSNQVPKTGIPRLPHGGDYQERKMPVKHHQALGVWSIINGEEFLPVRPTTLIVAY